MTDNKQIKIILVDDDKFLLDMYSMKFKTLGMDIITMSSGSDFLAKAREGLDADIVLLDIIMPNMDGIEIIEAIRKEKLLKDTVVIMLTNQADDEEKAEKIGIDGFIVKAMNIPSEVVAKVMDIYNKKKK